MGRGREVTLLGASFAADTNGAALADAVPASLLGPGLTVVGDLETSGDVHLEGRLQGDIAAGQISIGERGGVSGQITAKVVEIRGRVTGGVKAERVRVYSTAEVEGDITYGELALEAGARLEGRLIRLANRPSDLDV